jgi:hypothetical protein
MNKPANPQNSFILYLDSLDILDDMTTDQVGQLFLAIRDYKNGKEPKLSKLLQIAFHPIKNYLDRDKEKWEEEIAKRKAAGRKGGLARARSAKECQGVPRSAKQTQANQADSVSVSDSVSVNNKTMATPVDGNVDKSGFKLAKDLIAGMKSEQRELKLQHYWQERALYFCEKLEIGEKKRVIMKYFKENTSIMESICSYVFESPTKIKNPTAYILYEYKRRKGENKFAGENG